MQSTKRFGVRTGEAEFHATVEDHYRAIYYEALDLIIQCINDRFDQLDYRMYVNKHCCSKDVNK